MEVKILSLFVFSLFLSFTFGDDVLQLGDKDFASKMADHDAVLVMFYAPWCGHCKKLKPEFEKAANVLKSSDPPVALAKVDCTEDGKDTCSKYGVTGYPTLKIFKDGDLSSDYSGPREANGIIKFMKAQVGPASKLLTSVKEAEDFLAKDEVGVVYFGEGSSLKDAFMKLADKMRESVRFAHTLTAEVNEKYGQKGNVVLFRRPLLANKFEPSQIVYEGASDKTELETFIKNNFHGLVGHRTPDTTSDFNSPLVVAYYDVDYVKNPKGTNYWRNRILKTSQDFKDDFSFGISSKNDFQHEMNEYGLEFTSGDKPVICARNAQDQKFVMKEDFSMENLASFLQKLKNDELEAYLKSEEIPTDQDGHVIVAVGKNFDEVVTNSGRDALVEFYAPWCGHCKKLAPTFDDLAEKMKDEDVDIIKVDSTANDVPPSFAVKGFPTIYWKPKSGSPLPYEGGRELDDFVKYIAENAAEELEGFDRKGKAKKDDDTQDKSEL